MEIVLSHVYSEYSLLSSTNRIEPLVKRAKELGYKALALSDRHVMYGAVPFYEACLKHQIKPIFGLELTIEQDSKGHSSESALIRVYAKNQNGYTNLLKLSTIIGHKPDKKSYLTRDEVVPYLDDLMVVVPFTNGPLSSFLFQNREEQASVWLKTWLGTMEGSDCYLELQASSKMDKEMHQSIKWLSEKTGVHLLASQPCFYLEKKDAKAYQVVRSIKENVKIEDYPLERKEAFFYLQSPKEMQDLFKGEEVALKATQFFASKCSVHLELDKPQLPKYPNEVNQSSNEFLRTLCLEGCSIRYENISTEVLERLEKELAVIERMGFSDYFLIVWDFMKYAREQGILTGPGRGSAAGSLVAYVLQITNVDPLHYDLLFERFLNHERVSMPDIDIDFPDHRRDEIITYVQKKYGRAHVAQIITFGTLAARAVIRDVGKVLGADSYVIEQLIKQIPSAPGMTLAKALADSETLQELVQQSEDVHEMWKIALELEGLPRHSSTHAAGVVISSEPLTKVMALQAGQSMISLTQATMDIVEKLGLLKFDFLGLRNLTLLENITKLIEQQSGTKINLSDVPFDDEKTFQLLGKGETTGVFQLESPGMRQALKQLKPSEFEDIVAVNALYRPGPMKYIPTYVKGKHENAPISVAHPDLIPILTRTYGVIIYQEQIMEIASTMAGFSLAEADILRRAIGKKKKQELDQQREAFIKGANLKGYSRQVAEEVYELIERFADYGFNRSHAVAYSMISYYLAYLKVNYPLAFYTALLSGVWNQHDKLAHHIRECKDAGYEVLPPSVSKSQILFSIEDQGIRFGLLPIAHVGLQAARQIVQEGRKEAFTDLFSFAVRVDQKNVNKKALENLIKAGAMDEFEEDRATLLYAVEEAVRFASEVNSFQNETEGLFTLDLQPPNYRQVEPLLPQEKLDFEKEVLGFYLSGHPIEEWKGKLQDVGRLTVDEALTKQGTVRVAGLITHVKKIKTKKGEGMAFSAITDESGECELIIFPRTWSKHEQVFDEGRLVLVEGRFDQTKERLQLIVDKAAPVDSLGVKKELDALYLRITAEQGKPEILTKVKSLLLEEKGAIPVILYYERTQQTIHLSQDYYVSSSFDFLNGMKKLLGDENVVLKATI
ncbi:DNA polymerase III subunit alpha [Halalkalibacter alkalisediminis]|uniref:DNA polymerase III subunit alpha n=1 Tax=Halalkalibacter alkalisediminis TaxID=935616 RepID=A0ABV6NBA3_9BACI|nr:DNA polymerase III subunit alpha [Halalkalibacter alkalisediminis]